MADSSGTTETRKYTLLYEGDHPDTGELIVCIEGEHDRNSASVLDHDFVVFQVVEGGHRVLDNEAVGQQVVSLARSFYYMTQGVIVSTENQPTAEYTEGVTICRISVPEYGSVIIDLCGIVEYEEDLYQIAVAHPGPGIYLVVLLEVIDARPLTFRGVDVQDETLRNAIIDRYLVEIGAIEPAKEPNPFDEC